MRQEGGRKCFADPQGSGDLLGGGLAQAPVDVGVEGGRDSDLGLAEAVETTLRSTPASKARLALVCRSSWTRISGRPARWLRRVKWRVTYSERRAVPSSRVKA